MARLSQDPANLAPYIHVPGAGLQLRRVQNVNPTGNRPATDVREVGNESIVGTSFDTPAITADIEANLVNANILNQMANRVSGSTYSNDSLLDMLGNQDVDLQLRQRNTARTSWVQDVYIKQAGIGQYKIAASTNQPSTETYTLNANNKTAFERYIKVDHLTAVSSSQTAFTLTGTPVALTKGVASGNNLVSVAYAAESGSSTYLLEGTDYSVTGTSVTISSSAAAGISSGTQIMFAYQLSGSTPAGDGFGAKDSTSPAQIKGYYHVVPTMTVSGTSSSPTGVQSVNATVNFGIQTEVGMGNQAIGYSRNTPAEVTGDFTVFSTDYSLEKLLQTGQTSPSNTDFPIDGWRDDILITLAFKDPDTGTTLRTDVLSGLTIVNDAKDIRVGNAVGKQYQFRGSSGFDWLITAA